MFNMYNMLSENDECTTKCYVVHSLMFKSNNRANNVVRKLSKFIIFLTFIIPNMSCAGSANSSTGFMNISFSTERPASDLRHP